MGIYDIRRYFIHQAVDYESVRFFNLTVYVQDSNPQHRDEAYIEVPDWRNIG